MNRLTVLLMLHYAHYGHGSQKISQQPAARTDY